ncbi:proteasome assembly chaperone 4 isoform X1 [Puntigrus tetrazona]|uniref:proteasome assembly chaperone 4 isoform X1 n=1 Tax=Puntigrus tetrazona TaxID=1606681 RepID=UPI001C8A5284|nr:proteasome assembly chaperone 4 isoform X1 [Puntigrus tetrazona]
METALNGDRGAQAPVELITVHDFSEKILEQLVHFHVMKLSGGFFLWIGSNPLLSNLALALSSKYDAMPLSTLVLGDTSETTPSSLAQRLGKTRSKPPVRCVAPYCSCIFSLLFSAKKTRKQVFVSYNLPVTDPNLALLVENRIKKEMELHPDNF